jgi:hypothetical protein
MDNRRGRKRIWEGKGGYLERDWIKINPNFHILIVYSVIWIYKSYLIDIIRRFYREY